MSLQHYWRDTKAKTMRIVNRFASLADAFIETNPAAAIGVLTLVAVLWRSFK